MNKDALIERCKTPVEMLVRKYNNNAMDDDLYQIGMQSVWECLLRSEKDKMTNEDEIFGRCVIWARNNILNKIYEPKNYLISDEEDYIETYHYEEEQDPFLISDIDKSLTNKQKEIFEMLRYGYTRKEIKDKLKIKERMLIRHMTAIKK